MKLPRRLLPVVMAVMVMGVFRPSVAAAESASTISIQPHGPITAYMAVRINRLMPMYIQATTSSDLHPTGHQVTDLALLLAAVHYREHGLAQDNPPNGQGVFQLYSSGQFFRPGPITNAEFVRQARLTLEFLQVKALQASVRGLLDGSNATVAQALFSYNGRLRAYYQQAKALGDPYAFEGSPYVFNGWDTNHQALKMIAKDGDSKPTVVDNRPGSFTVWYELMRQSDPVSLAPLFRPAGLAPADPFQGEQVAYLPPMGVPPAQPGWAYAGFIIAILAVVVATRWQVFRQPVARITWTLGLVLATACIHHNQLLLRSFGWAHVTVASGFTLAALTLAGVLWLYGAKLTVMWYSTPKTANGEGRVRPGRIQPAGRWQVVSANLRQPVLSGFRTQAWNRLQRGTTERQLRLIMGGTVAYLLGLTGYLVNKTAIGARELLVFAYKAAYYGYRELLSHCLQVAAAVGASLIMVGLYHLVPTPLEDLLLAIGLAVAATLWPQPASVQPAI